MNKKNVVKIVIIALLVAGIGTATVFGTRALLLSVTGTVTNTFTVGSIETEIHEYIDGLTKKPYVKNVGKNPCYIRMRAEVSPIKADEKLNDYVDGIDSDNWSFNSKDGFWYYKGAVEPNETTTPLFTSVKEEKAKALAEGTEFDIILYQEAVQAEVTTPDGEKLTEYADIWEFYENYNGSNN